ncbi:TPA: hypothetical protein HA238_03070 [Candidatus Micrarchaeota archaeon]|nr:hypothetical protein [Candidatus Micrarchaeota archaeon]
MLIDYLEDAAREFGGMKEKQKELFAKYKQTMDRTIRDELAALKKNAIVKKREIYEKIYENLDEFRVLKNQYPALFQVYLDDENIGKFVSKKAWLSSFKEMKMDEIQKALAVLSSKMKQLEESKSELEKWIGAIDEKAIGATWPVLKGRIQSGMSKDEALQIVSDIKKELKRSAWLVLVNEPVILNQIHRFLNRLKTAIKEETAKRDAQERAKGHGTYQEFKAKQELDAAVKKRVRIEKKCRHLLMANPKFLRSFKKKGMLWRDKSIAQFMNGFLGSLNTVDVNQNELAKEVRKRIERA